MISVVEFYSGIGGIHAALARLNNENVRVCAAYEINPVANEVYSFNFPTTSLHQRNILSATAEELDQLDADLWTMSPPCQPFTRLGLQKDLNDRRTDSFQHLLSILSQMANQPRYIFIENVKGFENSDSHRITVNILRRCGYDIRKFLLSPKSFGIPNSRLRYYLLARSKNCEAFPPSSDENVITAVPNDEGAEKICRPLSKYLENRNIDYFDDFLLDDTILLKHAEVLDIVNNQSNSSCCFTKGYSHMVQGAGSVLQQNESESLDEAYSIYRNCSERDLKIAALKRLGLRWFTPREILNLSGFDACFDFPPTVSIKQRYRLLGNSVNVSVVSYLLQLLLN